ncbi:cytochrome P450 [Tuber magnatum]|uniref:Cytochrome P450 n=1 Tax=Tuber magnatum TaxID=42249 RepID=A0A317SUB8_9PEZI|nr:cytochrome P450 [Tuber magnatum]
MGIFMQLINCAKDKNFYGSSLSCVTIAFLFIGLPLLLNKEWSVHNPTKLPIAGIEYPGYFSLVDARRKFVSNGFHILRDAYYKYHGKNFVIATKTYCKVVLMHDQVRERSNAPEDTISFSRGAAEQSRDPIRMLFFSGSKKFCKSLYSEILMKVQSIGSMKEAILAETQFTLNTELPGFSTDEWVSVAIFPVALRIIARVSARAFISLPLCRNEDWLTITITFARDVSKAVDELAGVPKMIRPLYAYLWNPAKEVGSHKRKAESFLAPIIRERLEEESLAEKNATDYQKPTDLLQWLLDRLERHHKTPEALSLMLLQIGLASIHSTALSVTNTMFDLSQHQECAQQIREEMEATISANGGVLDRTVLRKMRKTGSFFKEVIRRGSLSIARSCMKNVTLSNGTYLPKGTIIGAPSAMFATDPEYIEGPETFHGFRWYEKSLGVKHGEVNANSCGTTPPNDLSFGHGRNALPGRFFAIEEMKTILTFILLQYDIKFPEGQSRPDNIYTGENSYPDLSRKLLFKKLLGPKKFPFL